MARFGIEGIRYFDHVRDAGYDAADLVYVFNICNGLRDRLNDAGHANAFYWVNTDCWEIDLRSVTMGGIDDDWADDVDLFFILTHGREDDGIAKLAYNVKINHWLTTSDTWRLGTDKLNWLMVYGCHSVDLDHLTSYGQIFQRLHEFCGAWGDMWESWTLDEAGDDIGDNLTGGDAVVQSWIDGVSDWWLDNHPIVVAAEQEATWGNGNPNWGHTTIARDHLWGHGTTVSDIFANDVFWLSCQWAEG